MVCSSVFSSAGGEGRLAGMRCRLQVYHVLNAFVTTLLCFSPKRHTHAVHTFVRSTLGLVRTCGPYSGSRACSLRIQQRHGHGRRHDDGQAATTHTRHARPSGTSMRVCPFASSLISNVSACSSQASRAFARLRQCQRAVCQRSFNTGHLY